MTITEKENAHVNAALAKRAEVITYITDPVYFGWGETAELFQDEISDVENMAVDAEREDIFQEGVEHAQDNADMLREHIQTLEAKIAVLEAGKTSARKPARKPARKVST